MRELHAAFDQIDKNKDGFLTKQELRGILEGVGQSISEIDEEKIDEMIQIADLNGDGKVDFNEFVAASQQ